MCERDPKGGLKLKRQFLGLLKKEEREVCEIFEKEEL